ncbi:MAG TPA: helix-turn-helix domain-containing protein [Burkholderiaceae bacterium]|nr:helix-turn-helix domain-containing protein [Burkholderiaceae bacterium]
MMRVFYGMRSGHAHRYQCRGDDNNVGAGLCIGIGGVRVDRAVAELLLEAVSGHAVEAAIKAVELAAHEDDGVKLALQRELEQAQYEASLAARRYEAVDPAKRLVARELERRWNDALEHVSHLEERVAAMETAAASRPSIDRDALMALAQDLPKAWNVPGTDARTKQRLTRILIHEVVIDLDDASNEAVVTVHWHGGRHTETRVARTSTGRYPADRHPGAVEVMRKLGGQWPDRELAVTMNRMRCKSADGETWTTVRVRELRERLGIPAFDPEKSAGKAISVEETAQRLKICVGSVHRLIRSGVLPATQLMPSAPWQVPVAALDSEAVRIGVREIMDRRPRNVVDSQDEMTLKLPGF